VCPYLVIKEANLDQIVFNSQISSFPLLMSNTLRLLYKVCFRVKSTQDKIVDRVKKWRNNYKWDKIDNLKLEFFWGSIFDPFIRKSDLLQSLGWITNSFLWSCKRWNSNALPYGPLIKPCTLKHLYKLKFK